MANNTRSRNQQRNRQGRSSAASQQNNPGYNEGNNPSQESYWTQPVWIYEEYWWAEPGPFTGVGPVGYQLSDEEIKQEVCRRLSQNGQVDASDIEVDVTNQQVTLKGTVDNRQQKRLAEDIAESVPGVDDVHNQIKINKQVQPGMRQGQRMESGQYRGLGLSSNLHIGQQVVGSQGRTIGTVKSIQGDDFIVDRPAAKDARIPFSAIEDSSGDQVKLNVPSEQIDTRGWVTA